MLKILEKLVARKTASASEKLTAWAELVANIVDEKLTDADEILEALDRLQKSPEDLQRNCELLLKRREWACQAAAGDAADGEYAQLMQQQAEGERALEILVESHRKKLLPLATKIEQARTAISMAADARRRLQETAGGGSRMAATEKIDGQLQALHAERQAGQRLLQDRRDWIFKVATMGNSAATGDLERLPSAREGLKQMQQADAEFGIGIAELQQRRNAAVEQLLKPEAI